VDTPTGRINNTEVETQVATVGLSRVGQRGFLGISGSLYFSDYGIPGGFLGGHANGVQIRLDHRQVEARSEYRLGNRRIEGLEISAAHSRYYHEEIESNDACGVSFGLLETEGSVRTHLNAGSVGSMTIALSGDHRDLANGCLSFLPKTTERTLSAALVDRRPIAGWALMGAARFDQRDVRPSQHEANKAGLVRDRSFQGLSGGFGVTRALGGAVSLSMTAMSAFHPHAIEELFSDGPHLAAYSYEVGNADLDPERGFGLEVAIDAKRSNAGLRLAAYRNAIDNYIQPVNTGELEYGPGDAGFLPRYQYSGRDALFLGGEAEGHVVVSRNVDLTINVGAVRGSDRGTGSPLPFVAPITGRVALRRAGPPWSFGLAARAAARQDRLGEFEEPMAGYVVLDATLGWTRSSTSWLQNLVLRIENITDAEYRNHLSRIKSIHPEAGRNVALLYMMQF
jgi:iron complex outermembrane receptor protein